MTPDDIITHIDDWLAEHAWSLDDKPIDFALDVRRLIADLELAQEAELLRSGV